MPLTLERSWTTLVLTDNGYDASIAKPEDVAPVIDTDIWNLEEQGVWIIRGLLLLGTVIFFIYYVHARKKNRRNL